MPTPTTLTIIGGDNQQVSLNTYTAEIVCYLRDENGNGMPNEPIVWSLPQGVEPGGGFALSGFTPAPYYTTTDSSGRGFTGFNNLYTNNIPGAWLGAVQSVAVGTVYGVYSLTNVDPPVPTYMSAQTNGVQSAAQNSNYLAVSVLIQDQFGNTMPGQAVGFTVPSGRGTWPGGGSLSRFVTTNGSGVAMSPILTASAVLGQFYLTVAYGNHTNSNIVSFTTIDPEVVVALSPYSGNNQSVAPQFPFALPLVARAANALNNPVAGVSVLFTAPASGASCTFPPSSLTATAVTDINGLATTPNPTANATAGAYSVAATKSGAQTAYFGLTNGGAPPTLTDALAMCEV